MEIEVVFNKTDPEKKKGDLLEKLAKEFLESQNYEVKTNIKVTGAELDLLCKNKTNTSKEIYVECKAYDAANKIQADVIKNLAGIKNIRKYHEAWLITTTQLGKEAQGLVDEIQKGEDSKSFTFFTPNELIAALTASNTIRSNEVATSSVADLVKDRNKLGKSRLVISEFGYFWAVEYLNGGQSEGLFFVYANDGVIVREKNLLNNLKSLETSFNHLDFFTIHTFLKQDGQDQAGVSLQDLRLNKSYIIQINDVGIRVGYDDKESLNLEDIFTYPDLESIESKERDSLSSRDLVKLKEGQNRFIIFGDDVSGKTSLALAIQKSIDNGPFIALYINADEIKHTGIEKFNNLLVRKFEKQYSNDEFEVSAFKKILSDDTNKVVLIIDDLDAIEIKRISAKNAFIGTLCQRFQNIYIFANQSKEIEMLTDSETKESVQDFRKYRIKQLGHVLRDELIEKWLTTGDGETISDEELLNKKNEISEKIRIAVGVNFVPTYPLYLLTMLQLIGAGSQLKLQGSSYAELYRYLINQALGSVNAKAEDLDFYHTYLSYLANHLFLKRTKSLSKEEMIEMYDDYSRSMDIEKKFDDVHQVLLKARLIKKEGDIFSFSHNYSYYFFAAKYLADNIHEENINLQIEELIRKLHRSESANIIIFLIHHSKNSNVIDSVINESVKLFNQAVPSTLSHDESERINKFIHQEIAISVEDNNPRDNRKKELERKDRLDAATQESVSDEPDDDGLNESDLFGKINLSLKLIEILGQITNNYYGSLNSERKIKILEEAYSLGLRTLNSLLGGIEKYLESIRTEIGDLIEKRGIVLSSDKQRITDEVIYRFMEAIVFFFIKRISDGVASKNIFITIDKIADKNSVPAHKLINTAVKLNFPNGLNSKKIFDLDNEFSNNHLTRRLLRLLVVEHIYKFDVARAEKQSICDKLGVKLLPNKI